jgi:hypothetical protein
MSMVLNCLKNKELPADAWLTFFPVPFRFLVNAWRFTRGLGFLRPVLAHSRERWFNGPL